MSLEMKNYGTWDIIKLTFKYAPVHATLIIVHKLLGGLVPTFQIPVMVIEQFNMYVNQRSWYL